MEKQKIHLIANAHLDPVWLWNWEEGAAEALATFRSAADICEENPGFVFNHNEALLYQWIEEYDPTLFKRISQLTKAGRWRVMGGWYLQPDCNLPSGESLVRQILAGRRYFDKAFGERPRTAINFDPFGHSHGLVQILAKTGFSHYLFCRPDRDFLNLPGETFWWNGPAGSRILCRRVGEMYNSHLGRVGEKVKLALDKMDPNLPGCVLWGVGNHGGGPSREDIRYLDDLISSDPAQQFLHSTPDQFFDDLKSGGYDLPEFTGELGRWAVGCYTSMIRIKQKHRALENAFFAAEKICMAATFQGGMTYPREALSDAARDLMFSEFHDILPGSCIASGEENSLRLLDHGLEIASRVATRAMFTLARTEAPAHPENIAIFVFNPHPWPLPCDVDCEFQLPFQNWGSDFIDAEVKKGDLVLPHQFEKEESNLPIDWRKRIVFHGTLRPSALTRFDVFLRPIPESPRQPAKDIVDDLAFQTSHFSGKIRADGLLDLDDSSGKHSLCRSGAALQVVADDFESWGSTITRFGKVAGGFQLLGPEEAAHFAGIEADRLAPLRIIEDGPVETVIEALLGWQQSRALLRYRISKNLPRIGLELTVHWQEKDHCLKLAFPLGFTATRFEGQTSFANQPLAMDGAECAHQKYCVAADAANTRLLALINDGIHGCDFRDGMVRLSLLRSAAYSALRLENRKVLRDDRFLARMDQGVRTYRFWIVSGQTAACSTLDAQAAACNEKPLALAMSPGGTGKSLPSFLELSNTKLVLSALKLADSSNDSILRVFNPTSEIQESRVRFADDCLDFQASLAPFEIKTWKINLHQGVAVETNLLEEETEVSKNEAGSRVGEEILSSDLQG